MAYSFDITYLPLATAIFAAVASLSGVWIANIFAARNLNIIHKNQVNAKDREVKLQKLEDLYFLFDRWQVLYSNLYLYHLGFHLGQLNYHQVMELTDKLSSSTSENGDFQKMQMLMNIYFTDLVNEYQAVEDCRKLITPFLQAAPNKSVDIPNFQAHQKNFEQVAKQFKEKIASTAAVVLC